MELRSNLNEGQENKGTSVCNKPFENFTLSFNIQFSWICFCLAIHRHQFHYQMVKLEEKVVNEKPPCRPTDAVAIDALFLIRSLVNVSGTIGHIIFFLVDR